MKLSDKILSGFVVVAAVGAIGIVVALRTATTKPAQTRMHVDSFSQDSIAYTGEAFDRVALAGSWKMKIVRGDTHSVTIKRDEDANCKLKVYAKGRTLTIKASTMTLTKTAATVTVTSPSIVALESKGTGEITLVGFTEDSLAIVTTGGTQVIARDCTLENLHIQLSGMSDINTKESNVRNAHLNTNGAYGVILSLNGGTLSGTASGMGGIEVYGDIGENRLSAVGLVDLKYHGQED